MPIRHKDAPAQEELYAPIEWRPAGEFEDILYEKGRGDREDHDQPPRGPERLPSADARRAARRLRPRPRRPRGGGDHLHRRRRRGLLLRRRPADPRRRRLHRRRRGRPAGRRPPRRRRPARPDPPHAEAGGGDGRRLRGGRRPHPASRLRPDDRRRQRPLRPDRAAGRQLRRRLRRRRSWHATSASSGPRRSGSCAASTTAEEALRDGARQRGRAASPSWSGRRSPGAARCPPSPALRCGC